MQKFIDYSRFNDEGINFNDYSNQLKTVIKANIGQQLYGSNVFESILNQDDAMLQKVLELENTN
jgi:carboxyl-terminal processing protease